MNIIIADHQARVRHGLRVLFEQQAGITVTAEAADDRELLREVREHLPDLVLVDWDLPDLPADRLLRLLHEEFPGLRILSMSGRQELGPLALRCGADGFACKSESPLKLLALIGDFRA